MEIGTIALLLIFVPVVGGLCCLPLRTGRRIAVPVVVTSAALMLGSALLFYELDASGVASHDIGGEGFRPLGWAVAATDFALMGYFLFLGLRLRNRLVVAFGAAQIVPLALLEATVFGHSVEPSLTVDHLAVVMALIINIVGSIICIYALKYMEGDGRRPSFFAMMLLFLGAMNGAVFANDLLWLFFFWEVTTLCSYVLIGHERTAEAREAAVRALVYTLGGGAALAVGLVLVNHYYDTLSLQGLLEADVGGGVALLPFALIALAAFTKSAQAPFQRWLLGAMVAPTPVSALLHSSTMVKLGVYVLIRMSPVLGASTPLAWSIALVGAVSFLGTSVLALTETNAKRVLAYSTIGNLGLVTMCVGINTPLAITAAMVLLLFHAVSKALLFMCVGVFKHGTGELDIEAMAGLRDRMPFVSVAFAVGVFTIMLPPFGMFAAKWLVAEATVSMPLLMFLLAAGFAATVVYYTKWLGRVLASDAAAERPSPLGDGLSGLFRYTLGALAVGAVALSFLVGWVVERLVNPFSELYFGRAVEGAGAGLSSALGEFPVVALLAASVAAFALAAVLLRPGREMLSEPYTGGETYPLEYRGSYLEDGLGRVRLDRLTDLAALAVLAALLISPFALEVGTWL